MYCSNCGKKINENADVCLNCGVIIRKNENLKKINNTKTIIALILGILALYFIFILVFFVEDPLKDISLYQLPQKIGFCIGYVFIPVMFSGISLLLSFFDRKYNQSNTNITAIMTSSVGLTISIFYLTYLLMSI